MKPYCLTQKVDAQRFRQAFQRRIASTPANSITMKYTVLQEKMLFPSM